MKLLLIRHGEAVDAGPDVSDRHRWLTARGRAETGVSGSHLRGDPPTAILTSPLVRAVQTAEIIATLAPAGSAVSVLAALGNGDHRPIVRFVEAWSGDGPLALVGHEPTLSEVLMTLLPQARWSGFEKSAVAALSREGSAWRFDWAFLAGSATTVDRLPV